MGQRHVLLAGTAVAALSAAVPAWTQTVNDEPIELAPITVTAFRSNADASTIPGSVQVITADELQARITTGETLERVLSDYVPGLSVSNGTIGGASQTLRGRRIQILVDGVARISELRGFSRELALINIESVERIEIVKGSNAQYGNGATGGTINVITKRAGDVNETTLTTKLSGQTTNFSDSLGFGVFASHNRRVGDFGIRLELSGEGMGDLFDGAGRQIPSDPLVGQGGGDNNRKYAIGVAADYTLGSHEFDFRFDGTRFEQTPNFFTNFTTTPVSVDTTAPYTGQPVIDDTDAFNLRYRNRDLAIGELEIQAYATDNKRRAPFVPAGIGNPVFYPISGADPRQNPLSQTQLETKTYGLRSTVRSDLSAWVSGARLTWGLDIGNDKVEQKLLDGTDVIAPMDQNSIAGFAQIDMPIGSRFDLSAGVRYERFDLTVSNFTRPLAIDLTRNFPNPTPVPAVNVTGGDFDYDATVFNIGGVYELTPSTDLFAGFSQGFSLPDVGAFTRRAPPTASGTISFASLAPEPQIVDTYEIGVRHASGAFDIEASAFFATSDEGTIFNPLNGTITQQKEETWGAEVIANYAVNHALNLGISAGFTEGRFDSTGNGDTDSWLPNNRIGAPIKATLFGDYNFGNGLRMAGEVVHTGSRSKPGTNAIASTITVNLRMAKMVGPGELSLAVDNLFDTNQLNPTASVVRINPLTRQDIPVAAQGRRIWAGYSVNF